MKERSVSITPRLRAALEMLEGFNTIADIGCDHGRLTAALLQRNTCVRVIASDISEPSLQKARLLVDHIGLGSHVSFRAGDGCTVLNPGECDAIALLGMGGTLMCRILDDCALPLMGAKAVVLQPMRAQDDIRSYLHRNLYRITDDRVVYDHGRYYQVFKAEPGEARESFPNGFPIDFFDVGYRSFSLRDANLPALCLQQLACHQKMMRAAAGTDGESVLNRKINALHQILKAFQKEN